MTPFDSFMRDASAWLDSAWYVWVALAFFVALIVTVVVVSKMRARARARVPQYRRQGDLG
jgi:heme exporter protein D